MGVIGEWEGGIQLTLLFRAVFVRGEGYIKKLYI